MTGSHVLAGMAGNHLADVAWADTKPSRQLLLGHVRFPVQLTDLAHAVVCQLRPMVPISPRAQTVHALLAPRRPSAVLGRVRSVVVDAVEGVLRGGLRSHVGKEGVEATTPAVAYRDPSAAVGGVATMRRLLASSDHAVVGSREGMSVEQEAPREPASAVTLRERFPLDAAARLGVSAHEVGCAHDRATPAIALARPGHLLVPVGAGPRNDVQTAEALAGQIERFGHIPNVTQQLTTNEVAEA